jgi:hypothetical protein
LRRLGLIVDGHGSRLPCSRCGVASARDHSCRGIGEHEFLRLSGLRVSEEDESRRGWSHRDISAVLDELDELLLRREDTSWVRQDLEGRFWFRSLLLCCTINLITKK